MNIIAGLSGGVDSSTAALLLTQRGYTVEGVFMKNWEEDDTDTICAASEDVKDASHIAEQLNIPFHKANFSAEYWDNVFEHFLSELRAGRTPNPDILCNKEIKFNAFLSYAEHLGADYIATGHYARRSEKDGQFYLLRSIDQNKDQTYFLYTLNQHQLSKTCFPIGAYTKPWVRRFAKQSNLKTHAKKDSTGICFIGERRFSAFLQRFIPKKPGAIESIDGQHLGQHEGLMYYTLGQRQGLGIGGRRQATDQPWYVAEKNMDTNTLIVVQGHDHPALFTQTLQADQLHWVAGTPPAPEFICTAKTRYRQTDRPCSVNINDEGATIRFESPQWAVTPGQSIVFYHGVQCLGGGIITQTA